MENEELEKRLLILEEKVSKCIKILSNLNVNKRNGEKMKLTQWVNTLKD